MAFVTSTEFCIPNEFRYSHPFLSTGILRCDWHAVFSGRNFEIVQKEISAGPVNDVGTALPFHCKSECPVLPTYRI